MFFCFRLRICQCSAALVHKPDVASLGKQSSRRQFWPGDAIGRLQLVDEPSGKSVFSLFLWDHLQSKTPDWSRNGSSSVSSAFFSSCFFLFSAESPPPPASSASTGGSVTDNSQAFITFSRSWWGNLATKFNPVKPKPYLWKWGLSSPQEGTQPQQSLREGEYFPLSPPLSDPPWYS